MKSIYSFIWLTKRCKKWLLKHCQLEDYQIQQDKIIVEFRYAIDILHGLKENGFEALKDFYLI